VSSNADADARADAGPDALIVFVTVPDPDVGARIGRTLVEERLAACVNVLPGLRSIYLWKDAVADEAEALCLIKTRPALFDRLEARLRELHPYDVPEILALKPVLGNADYLRWLTEATSGPRTS
jgi:periplasmic divalent cation tolerance protein